MKDLKNNPELKRYRTDPPIGMEELFRRLSAKSEVYAFEFPLEGEVLKTLILKNSIGRIGMHTKISVSIQSSDKSKMRPIYANEMYVLRNFLLNPDGTLVWQYSSKMDKIRSTGFRNATGNNFDMTDLVMQLMEFTGEMPPLEEAYAKKTQKNKGLIYSRGTIGNWRFVHASVPGPEPWIVLKKIADREFKSKTVFVLFNKETEKHPYEYILWVMD